MTTLTLDVIANDKGAGRTVKEIGDHVENTGSKIQKFRAGAATVATFGMAFNVVKGAAGAVKDVLTDCVSAYTEAQTAQLQLEDAFTRFPKLANTNIQSLRDLNSELMKKTRFDDDAIASGQAVLAQFNLTGKQLQSITPLLLDYAAKTGQDVPAAAEKLGKAFLGNTKALKELGINYKSTGNQAKDTENIVKLLSGAVGGFAEKEGKTAAGRAEILKNTFGEIQEEIGAKVLPILTALGQFLLEKVVPAIELLVEWLEAHLAPILVAVFGWIRDNVFPIIATLASWIRDTLIPAIVDLVGWLRQHWDLIKNIAIVLAAMAAPILIVVGAMKLWAEITKIVTAAQLLLNLAMRANPILLIVSLIAGLVAAFIILWNKSEGFRNFFIGAWEAIKNAVRVVIDFVVAYFRAWFEIFSGIVKKVGEVGSTIFNSIKDAIVTAVNWVKDRFNELIGWFRKVPGWIGEALAGIGDAIGRAFKNALNVAIGVINWFIRRANDIIHGINVISPFADIPKIPEIQRLHTGGIVPGSRGQERLAILEAGETVLPARANGALGSTVVVNINAPVGSSQELENWLASALDNLSRRGRLA